MSHHHNHATTFESRFGAFVPEDTRVSNDNSKELIDQIHNDAGIIVKAIAYLIDVGVSVLLIPIIYNIYHYLKRGQTLGQQIMGIRIYRHHHVGIIAKIPQLLTRVTIKLMFLALWTVLGANIVTLLLSGWPSYAAVIVYTTLMIICIHAYASTMITNKHRRGLQDIWSGTIVAYDGTYSIKRFIIGTILCSVLYYVIIGLGPQIVSWIATHTHGGLETQYWQIWNYIDSKVINSFLIFQSQIHLQ